MKGSPEKVALTLRRTVLIVAQVVVADLLDNLLVSITQPHPGFHLDSTHLTRTAFQLLRETVA